MSEKHTDAPAARKLMDMLGKGRAETAQQGAARFTVPAEEWTALARRLGGDLDMMALWADEAQVHMALFDRAHGDFAIASVDLEDGAYPSVGAHHPPALLPERIIRDMHGHTPEGLPDTRPWLDHGKWPLTHPLAAEPGAPHAPEPYHFLGARGDGLHQIPVGPVHAGIIEPGHFRFFCAGEIVVRLEARLGYTHKGVEKLLQGRTPQEAAPVCARISGDSTVAWSWAFAAAVEAALKAEIPPRAVWLRALMAEMERLANHLGDTGAVCNDAAFAFMHAHFGVLREDVLRAAKACFGHRLMMDKVIPGGVAADLDADGFMVMEKLIAGLRERLMKLMNVYDNTASLLDRTRKTGILSADLARQFAAGGYVGRAAGRDFDARRDLPCAPYDHLPLDVARLEAGDVDARIRIRMSEAMQSLTLCERIIRGMPDGEILAGLPDAPGAPAEGVAVRESFRGDVLLWVRLDCEGRVSRCYARDPSLFQWPLLEAVIENNIVGDFPLCNKSFNCSYSGSDL